MRMYWVLFYDSFSSSIYLPLSKIKRNDLRSDIVVIYDIYDVVEGCCFIPKKGFYSLNIEITRNILKQAQFEDGEESTSNTKAIQDLLEIFPDLIREFGVDYRPGESIPEDYYA